jgi:hypothetical protein
MTDDCTDRRADILPERHQRVSAVEGAPGGIGALAEHARPAA